MLAKYVLPLALAVMFVIPVPHTAASEFSSTTDFFENTPLAFTQNAGQWDDRILFRAETDDATMWFLNDGAYYQFERTPSADALLNESPDDIEDNECLMIKATFVGANETALVSGQDIFSHHSNYFFGNDQSRWRTNVPSFEAITYRDIYPGIDLKYYGNGYQMEYDFIVAPGSDLSHIEIRYDGAISISVNEAGELEIETEWGTVVESSPYVYQVDGIEENEFDGRYLLLSDNSFGFEIDGNYNTDLPLVIDPVLTYSSYLAGSGSQYVNDIVIDNNNCMVVVGQTRSEDFPVYEPIQNTYAGTFDLFITKISTETSEILYSTYFGGSGREDNPHLVLDADDNMYLICTAYSTDLPTVNAFQASLNGTCDAYVFKLNSHGDEILFATYYGGEDVEYAADIEIDASLMVYIAGNTISSELPLQNPFCDTAPGVGGELDGFVAKFNASGSALIYATYLGGKDRDVINDLAITSGGEAYVVGSTFATDFPVANPLYNCMILANDQVDAFITKFSAGGNTLAFSTYIGGTETDWLESIDLDADGNAYMLGCSMSDDFPVLHAIQPERVPGGINGGADMIIAAISSAGDELLFGTYFGGSDEDYGEGLSLGPDGSIFITGYTYSPDFPLENYIDGVLDGVAGTPDALVVRLTSDGTEVAYSTYLGGSNSDVGIAIASSETGYALLTGYTISNDFPLVNETQSSSPGYYDVFVSRIEGGCCLGSTGNIDGDDSDSLNLLDIIYAIQWYFQAGNGPPCPNEADVDGSGVVDIEDLTYMVNHIFMAGPDPVECQAGTVVLGK